MLSSEKPKLGQEHSRKARRSMYGSAAYLHLNADRKARQMESSYSVRKHRPPMNLELQEDNES